jgi:hypothetical protein
VNDDYGPYKAPTGFSKFAIQSVGDPGNGGSYSFSIYTSGAQKIADFINGTFNPAYFIWWNAVPPPQTPNAGYGAAGATAGITEDMWALAPGVSVQGGTGTEANPIVVAAAGQSKILLLSYPVWYIRAKLTAIGGAPTGNVQLLLQGIP